MIDAHTHFFPPELHPDPRGWAAARRESHWADLVSPPGRASVQGWSTRERMLADMDEAGVRHAVLTGWYWESPDTCRWHNQVMAAVLAEQPERFSAFAACNPSTGVQAVREELNRARRDGFAGVGELLPQVQGYGYDHPGFLACLDTCAEWRWPVLLHVTEPVGREYPGRVDTPLDALYRFLVSRPDNTFILAHWGGLLPFYELNPAVARSLEHVYYDTAASPLLYRDQIFAAVVEIVGAERILFGSDYPLLNFPRREKQPGFQTFIQRVRATGLPEDALEAIFSRNAQHLLGLKS